MLSRLRKDDSSKYTQQSLNLALELQKSMDADMGGTEIYQPFQHIFSKRLIQGNLRQVFLLTDGEVSNLDQLIGLVKANAHNTRVFTLGIGSGVSSSLIKGVARAGNGKAELIADTDRLQPKVISLLKCATQQSISDLELEWHLPKQVTAVSIPEHPPRFMTVGERLCMYALVKGGAELPESQDASVTLNGQCDGNPIHFKTEFPLSSKLEVCKSAPLHRLAAKSQIKMLETEEAGSEDAGRRDNDSLNNLRQEMILLSTSANIISRMTAFVAVDKDAKRPVEGEMVKRPCPVPVATKEFNNGLMTLDSFQFASSYRCMSSAASSPQRYRALRQTRGMPVRISASNAQASWCMGPVVERGACSEQLRPMSASRSSQSVTFYKKAAPGMQPFGSGQSSVQQGDKMIEMIGLQKPHGYWKMTSKVISLLGVSDKTIKSVQILKDTDVITTLASILWLRSKFTDRHDEWAMIEKKALAWLNSKINESVTLAEAFDGVEKALWPNGL